MQSQQLYIYRSNNKPDTYLFLTEKDHFDKLPSKLARLLGELSFSFEFMLDENKKLMQSSAINVLKAIETDGFYLQLPAKKAPQKHDPLAKFYRR